jgi:ribose 5-phosphate isomerase B
MKIAIGNDHAGLQAKQRMRDRLAQQGHAVTDCGTGATDSVDYPDFARAVAEAVAAGRAERGILVCGTGIGMSITANKVRGVRAAKCNDPYEARMSRAHNDANVLCLGARVVDASVMDEIVDGFLRTDFEAGRHARRVEKMMEAEGHP